jgi:hypothetical protein
MKGFKAELKMTLPFFYSHLIIAICDVGVKPSIISYGPFLFGLTFDPVFRYIQPIPKVTSY